MSEGISDCGLKPLSFGGWFVTQQWLTNIKAYCVQGSKIWKCKNLPFDMCTEGGNLEECAVGGMIRLDRMGAGGGIKGGSRKQAREGNPGREATGQCFRAGGSMEDTGEGRWWRQERQERVPCEADGAGGSQTTKSLMGILKILDSILRAVSRGPCVTCILRKSLPLLKENPGGTMKASRKAGEEAKQPSRWEAMMACEFIS